MNRYLLLPMIFLWLLYIGVGGLIDYLIYEKSHKKHRAQSGLLGYLGIWFLLGAGVVTFLEFIFSLAGIAFKFTLLGFIPLAILGVNFQKKKVFSRPVGPRKVLLFWFGVLAVLYLLFIRLISRVIYSWDAVAFWLPKMFSLWVDQTVNIQALIHFNHPEYPLFLPLTGANVFTILDQPHDIAVKAVIFGFSLSLIFIIGDFLLKKVGFLKAVFFMAIFLSSFVLREHIAGEYVGTADVLLGTYLVAGTIYLLKDKPRLALLFWAFCPWVKSEGLVIFGVSFLLLLVFYKNLRNVFSLVGPLLVLPWFLYVKYLKIDTSQYFKFAEIYERSWLDYAIYSIHAFREEFRNIYKWSLLFFFFLAGSLTKVKKILQNKKLLMIYMILGAQLMMYLIIFTITPEEQASFIAPAISRLTLHLAPTVLVVTAWLFGKKKGRQTNQGSNYSCC